MGEPPGCRLRPEDARRAFVTPRATTGDCRDALDLEDAVDHVLSTCDRAALVGGPGSGRTTALRHLAAVRPHLTLLDKPKEIDPAAHDVVYTTDRRPRQGDGVVRLEPWDPDDAIAYVLARHPARRDVLRRLLAAPDLERLAGCPELWRVVLVLFARQPEVTDVRAAFRLLMRDGAENLLRHEGVRVVRDADAIVRDPSLLRDVWPEEVIRDVASEPAAVAAAEELVTDKRAAETAMAASVLHATGSWRPTRGRWSLSNGHFRDAAWGGLDLSDSDLSRADLDGAFLTRACLDRTTWCNTQLRGAYLRGASLVRVIGWNADLRGADLRRVLGAGARFDGANLSAARLDGASLPGTGFRGADLHGASLAGANLQHADLSGVRIDGADLRNAVLDGANLLRVSLRRARLSGARFRGSYLGECDLEHVRLPEADFARALLPHARLTDSVMPRARFLGASLIGARLAGISWPGADLQNANLEGAQFHFGSARSGLVDSFLASEGTRTGYYTDESQELHFRPPEEVRKANLRGADLRGAAVERTDWYLVDLRDARYTSDQRAHFVRCRAILGT